MLISATLGSRVLRVATFVMMTHSRVFILVLAVLLARSAWSQEDVDFSSEPLDTLRPYVRASYGYDSNLFRLENDQQARALLGTTDKSEAFHTLAAGMDIDWRISRQVLLGRFEVNQTRFDKYKQLDYRGYAGLLQWNWLIGKYAAGDLGVSENKALASFNDLQSPTQNALTTRQLYAHGGIKLALPWQLNLGFVRTTTDNSATSQQVVNYNENKYSAGVQYETEKGTLLEIKNQYRKGDYPNRQIVGTAPVDNDYQQYDTGVGVQWFPTIKTKLNGELNYTQRRYGDVPQRNFSGATGRLAADWMATEKTTLGLAFYRDIGVVENNTASYSLNRGFNLSAAWRPTVKLTFKGRAIRERQTYAGDPGFVLTSSPTRQDDVSNFQLEANYKILRKTRLGLQVQHGTRHSNQALAGYTYNSALMNLRSEF